MFNFLLPSRIYLLIEKTLKFISSVFFPILLIGLTFALAISPPDYIQGDSVRIMYLHVPSAWIGLACFASTFFATGLSLAPVLLEPFDGVGVELLMRFTITNIKFLCNT